MYVPYLFLSYYPCPACWQFQVLILLLRVKSHVEIVSCKLVHSGQSVIKMVMNNTIHAEQRRKKQIKQFINVSNFMHCLLYIASAYYGTKRIPRNNI